MTMVQEAATAEQRGSIGLVPTPEYNDAGKVAAIELLPRMNTTDFPANKALISCQKMLRREEEE